MAMTPVSRRPSERIGEILLENESFFKVKGFSNTDANVYALQKYLDEQWEEEQSYIFDDKNGSI